MPGLSATPATRGALAPLRWATRRVRARRGRGVPRAAVQPPLELGDPLVLTRDTRFQPADLLIHPQQHRNHNLAALVVDRLRLGALHTPVFDAAELCPPDQLNAYVANAEGGPGSSGPRASRPSRATTPKPRSTSARLSSRRRSPSILARLRSPRADGQGDGARAQGRGCHRVTADARRSQLLASAPDGARHRRRHPGAGPARLRTAQGRSTGMDKGLYAFMRRVLATDHGEALYRRRQATVEPAFAQIKFNRRIDRFQTTRRPAVRSEWRLAAATHNRLEAAQPPISGRRALKGPGARSNHPAGRTRAEPRRPLRTRPHGFSRHPPDEAVALPRLLISFAESGRLVSPIVGVELSRMASSLRPKIVPACYKCWVSERDPTSASTLRERREAVVREHMESENHHDFDTTIATFAASPLRDHRDRRCLRRRDRGPSLLR